MSDVLIKGMKMPSKCLFCPCYDVEFGKCEVTHKRQSFRAKPSDCPLIPVPPHGRLIDADALFKAFQRAGWYNNADRDEVADAIVLDAPTIIPAKEET